MICDDVADTVVSQLPPAGASLVIGGHVMAYTVQTEEISPQELICVPDFTGLGDVDAVRLGRLRGLEITLTGTGICVRQTPAAGEYVTPGATVEVVMDPLAGPDE